MDNIDEGEKAEPENTTFHAYNASANLLAAPPARLFYHHDALGSVVNLTDDAAAVTQAYLYDAWGNYRELDLTDAGSGIPPVFSSTPDLDENGLFAWELYLEDVQQAFAADANRFTYTGHEFDPATGLYYFRARFYDPELGRFTSADPYLGDTLTPPSLHRYLYAYANPLVYVDLSGYHTTVAVDRKKGTQTVRLDHNPRTGASDFGQNPIETIRNLLDLYKFQDVDEEQGFLKRLVQLNPELVVESEPDDNHYVWDDRQFYRNRLIKLPLGYKYSRQGIASLLSRSEKQRRALPYLTAQLTTDYFESFADGMKERLKQIAEETILNSNPIIQGYRIGRGALDAFWLSYEINQMTKTPEGTQKLLEKIWEATRETYYESSNTTFAEAGRAHGSLYVDLFIAFVSAKLATGSPRTQSLSDYLDDFSKTVKLTETNTSNGGACSVWEKGPSPRGLAIEDAIEESGLRSGRLPPGFRGVDFHEVTVTSVKSIDLNAKTYQDPLKLLRTIQNYVDKVRNFKGASLNGTVIRPSDIKGRGLDLVIPPGQLSPAQRLAIENASQYAKSQVVQINVFSVE